MKESDIQKQISDFLEYSGFLVIKINNVGIMKPNGSYIPPRQKGISDLIACKNGRFYAFEVKNEKGKLTKHQELFLEQVKVVGGVAGVVRSIEDVKKKIK
jgi:Holliday junction resolvase